MKYLISLLFLGLTHFLIAQESKWEKEIIQKLQKAQDSFKTKKKYQVRKQIRQTKKHLELHFFERTPTWNEKVDFKHYRTYFCDFISYQNGIDILIYLGHDGYCCFIFENKNLVYSSDLLGYSLPQNFAHNPGFWRFQKL